MKRLSFLTLFMFPILAFSQGYNEDRTTLANFLKRMYNTTRFEGAKIVEDYDNQYLISVLSLVKGNYEKESNMFRVAQVKALRQASEFVNGSTITSEAVIRTKESNNEVKVTVETVENMRSVGFVQGMELLANFESANDKEMVFIYLRKIEVEKKEREKNEGDKKGKKKR